MEIHTIEPFLQYFGNIRERTLRVARCIPPDRIDWAPRDGQFTLGDFLRHLAVTERYMWAETVNGRQSRYTSHGKEFGATLDEVMALMERLHAESLPLFTKLSDQDLQKKCKTPGGTEISTWKWLRAMTEHEAH